MSFLHAVATALADAWLAGPWTEAGMFERGRAALPVRRELTKLVRKARLAFPEPPHAQRSALIALLAEQRVLGRGRPVWSALPPARMGNVRLLVPLLPTTGDVAQWLGLDVSRLEWLADRRNLLRDRPEGFLHSYLYRWVPKRSGGLRLLETPKPWLKAIQRKILREILDRVPPHEAACGFRPGRSVVDFARPHADRDVVLRLDLRDFFPATSGARVRAVFAWLGYPEPVARLFAALCTSHTPRAVRARAPDAPGRFFTVQRLASAHLPQGAPTSPALANLCAFPLDVRLAGAARAFDGRYTRYADDLAFSGQGNLAGRAEWFASWIAEICREEGYPPNLEKLRIMGRGQRQELAGVGINAHPNVSRRDYDRLKAALHAWGAGHVPDEATQRRLLGEISWVAQRNPAKGTKLRARWDTLRGG